MDSEDLEWMFFPGVTGSRVMSISEVSYGRLVTELLNITFCFFAMGSYFVGEAFNFGNKVVIGVGTYDLGIFVNLGGGGGMSVTFMSSGDIGVQRTLRVSRPISACLRVSSMDVIEVTGI